MAGLRKDRTTSLAAVAILALGLAAPVTFFSILRGGGLRPLPVPDGDRIVRVEVLHPRGAGRRAPVTFRDVESFGEVAGVEAVGAFRTRELALGTREMGTLPVSSAMMTPATFELLQVPPALGRIPEAPEGRGALILGHELWERHFGSDPGVLGRPVEVDGEPHTVVAVMPDGFQFPFRQGAWALADPADPPPGTDVEPVLRVRKGADPRGVEQQVAALWHGRDEVRPTEERGAVVRVRPFTRGRGEAGEGWAFLGLVLVGLCLLVIACVNAANLLLARALDRMRLLGVQSALGASRGHLATQLFLEALLLAAAGGILGLLLAHGMATHIQDTMGPENFGYYWMRVSVDGPVVVFAGLLVLGTALAAGTLPVVRVLRSDLQRVLKAGAEPAVHGPFRGWSWGRVFVTGQLALSCFALVAAGLTAGAMRTASRFGGGLPGDEVLVASYRPPEGRPGQAGDRVDARRRIQAALQELPGVQGSALALGAPGYYEPWSPVEVEGGRTPDPGTRDAVFANAVTPGFFPSLGLELVRGRLLGEGDAPGAAPVAVVTESFARIRAPGGVTGALGLSVRIPALDSTRTYQVVGVIQDPGLQGGSRVREEAVYIPLVQTGLPGRMLLVRGEVSADLGRSVRAAVARAGSGWVVGEIRTLEEGYRFMTRAQSTLALLAVTGGLAGLLVAGAGLYALLAFRVRRSRREMGIRLALGADGARLARNVVGSALGQLVPGMVVGLGLAWLAAPLLGILLLGGDPRSPAAYALVAGVFLASGLGASLVPALRAAAVEPARVLAED